MRYDRFWSKVAQLPGEACWEWRGSIDHGGYGQYRHNERTTSAHRYAYENRVGPIPAGMTIDHLCRNRACVRPDHLEAVTQRTNLLRGQTKAAENARKTTCPQGHDYTPENTYTPPSGGRQCKQCRSDRKRHEAEVRATRRTNTARDTI